MSVHTSSRRAVADRVPVDQIRDAFLEGGFGASEVAREAGWTAADKGRPLKPDSSRVLRTMGLRPVVRKGQQLALNRSMSYENAVALVRAMGFDPVDFDV